MEVPNYWGPVKMRRHKKKGESEKKANNLVITNPNRILFLGNPIQFKSEKISVFDFFQFLVVKEVEEKIEIKETLNGRDDPYKIQKVWEYL